MDLADACLRASDFSHYEEMIYLNQPISKDTVSPFEKSTEKSEEFLKFLEVQFFKQDIKDSIQFALVKPASKTTQPRSDADAAQAPNGQPRPQSQNQENQIATKVHTIDKNPVFVQSDVIVHFPVQFEAMRMLNNINLSSFIEAMVVTTVISVSGGKKASQMSKSINGLFVVKQITDIEFMKFKQFAIDYLRYFYTSQVKRQPSLLVKIYGLYEIRIAGKDPTYHIVMENAFVDLNIHDKFIKIYDLKGSETNRLATSGEVLLDTNFKIDRNGEPIIVHADSYGKISHAIDHDSELLMKQKIVDYSLLLVVNSNDHTIRAVIIDFLRLFNIEKELEYIYKKAIKLGKTPTIVGPEKYKERFAKQILSYIAHIKDSESISAQQKSQ